MDIIQTESLTFGTLIVLCLMGLEFEVQSVSSETLTEMEIQHLTLVAFLEIGAK